MTQYTFAPPAETLIPVVGSDALFPVRRIYCVGRNYAEHAREMGVDPDREPPFFFSKPRDAVVPGGGNIPFPPATNNLQHEVELVVAMAKGGKDIPEAEALSHVYGYATGIDFTRRDLQMIAREKCHPWEPGKGMDHGAPITAIVPATAGTPAADAAIWLKVNGETRQSARLNQVIWSVPEVISRLSHYFELAPGDLIFTGTPGGVSTVVRGDSLTCGIDGLPELEVVLI
ncbi:MAG: fumarylacetoacetate hydrolase family protein [Rhodocyclaceae bacterium]|jgi:fumarylpyruvate hydrolase|nr:fumarylacetoacetate hydrolase family protein [Rhodocyclaceae bacterium]